MPGSSAQRTAAGTRVGYACLLANLELLFLRQNAASWTRITDGKRNGNRVNQSQIAVIEGLRIEEKDTRAVAVPFRQQ